MEQDGYLAEQLKVRESKIADLELSKSHFISDLQDINNKFVELSERYNQKALEVNLKEREQAEVKAVIDSLERTCAQLKEDNSTKQAEIDRLQASNSKLEDANTHQQDTIKTL